MSHTPSPADPLAERRRASIMPLVFVASVGGSYWMNFIWFYLRDRWGEDSARNLIMNAAFGLVYTLGCMRTARVSRRASPRSMLVAAYSLLILSTAVSSILGSPAQILAAILLHGYVIARTWPNLEMLATRGRRGEELGRAVGFYNIGWALTSTVGFAIAGRFYEWSHATLFVIPCAFWAATILLVLQRVAGRDRPGEAISIPAPEEDPEVAAAPKELAETMRSAARWGNMAGYIMVSALMPILPAVTARLGLGTAGATAFGALWQGARVAAFFALGKWHGWHFRPKLFLGCLASLPILFGVVALSDSLALAAAAQAAMGFALGLIYMSALFYSMHGEAKTSDAATHEAVIGAGIMAGPLLGAAAGKLGPLVGVAPTAAIAAGVIAILLAVCAGLGWKLRGAGGAKVFAKGAGHFG